LPVDLLPGTFQKLLFIGFELAFGRAHQVMSAALAQHFQIVFTDDASVKDPHTARLAMLALHCLEDLAQGSPVSTVTREYFVGQRKAFRRDDQRND